jgi:hypothetical protein
MKRTVRGTEIATKKKEKSVFQEIHCTAQILE